MVLFFFFPEQFLIKLQYTEDILTEIQDKRKIVISQYLEMSVKQACEIPSCKEKK